MTKLPLLCPQLYDGTTMLVVTCDRCSVGWDKKERKCRVTMGIEHFPLDPKVPSCPLQDRCQHQIQLSVPCAVRARGLVCESALTHSGMSELEASSHPLSFNAYMTASLQDLEELEGIRDVEDEE